MFGVRRSRPTRHQFDRRQRSSSTVWHGRDLPASRQSALQIERAAHPYRIVMGREPRSSGPPPGVTKPHEEIPFGFQPRGGLVIVEHAAAVDAVQVDVLVVLL